jgi:hypothetical protein
MSASPILFWPAKNSQGADYQMARKVINGRHGAMPEIICDDIDVADILTKRPDAILYYPVFCESTGWWGELLGSSATVTDKLIISPECQLMAIENAGDAPAKKGQSQLLAAEIYPTSGFFKKMNSNVATVADMLATDAGTILALFSGKSRTQFINIIESTGNSYLGCVGRY